MPKVITQPALDPFAHYRHDSPIGISEYSAGFPSYEANFTRDTLESGLIAGRADLLISQLEISAHYQGTADNQLTGEQPGKIHHEMPGAQLADRGAGFTTYNACDSTALFLIAAEDLSYLDHAAFIALMTRRRSNFERAVDYILALTGDDNLCWDKTPDGSTGYTLRVTYWKDSILPRADGKQEPVYPVAFAQAHFIAARGLLSASRILGRPALAAKADAMFRAGIAEFMRPEAFVVYKDSAGELRQTSSDELHALAYIPVYYAGFLPINAIKRRAARLATPYGFLCTPASVAQRLEDQYHGEKIWVFEQANIHYGATKFGLADEAATAARIAGQIGAGQELFGIEHHVDGSTGLIPEGNDRQLWSVAAAEYFKGKSNLSTQAWL